MKRSGEVWRGLEGSGEVWLSSLGVWLFEAVLETSARVSKERPARAETPATDSLFATFGWCAGRWRSGGSRGRNVGGSSKSFGRPRGSRGLEVLCRLVWKQQTQTHFAPSIRALLLHQHDQLLRLENHVICDRTAADCSSSASRKFPLCKAGERQGANPFENTVFYNNRRAQTG